MVGTEKTTSRNESNRAKHKPGKDNNLEMIVVTNTKIWIYHQEQAGEMVQVQVRQAQSDAGPTGATHGINKIKQEQVKQFSKNSQQ